MWEGKHVIIILLNAPLGVENCILWFTKGFPKMCWNAKYITADGESRCSSRSLQNWFRPFAACRKHAAHQWKAFLLLLCTDWSFNYSVPSGILQPMAWSWWFTVLTTKVLKAIHGTFKDIDSWILYNVYTCRMSLKRSTVHKLAHFEITYR